MRALCLLFLLSVTLQANANLQYFERDRCATSGKVMAHLSEQIVEVKTYVFSGVGQTIDCIGKISQWEFYAREEGSFYAAVWRHNRTAGYMKLVGKNKLTADAIGYNKMEIPIPDRINVRNGDSIGIHFERSSDPGVLSLEKTDTKIELGSVTTSDIYADGLTQGVLLTETDEFNGAVSLKATVSGITMDMGLVDGPTANEGRVEILIDEIWGTVCDLWYKPRGWPLLTCYELGYPDIISAGTTGELDKGHADESTHIHMMSPRCKPSQNKTLLTCPLHPKGLCGHDHDMYIECAPKFKLTSAPEVGPGYGIPMAFEAGMWGNICDDRDPTFHLGEKKTWLTALCRELDYSGLEDVKRVENPLNVGRSFMENPDCGTMEDPTLMKHCPSGPLETDCDGYYYHVKCKE